MIYRVINGNIELVPDAISLVPAFAKLSQSHIKYLVIAYDYVDGPYKRKPEEVRKDLAKKATGLTDHDFDFDTIEEFKACLYDVKRDRKQLYQKKLIMVQGQFEVEINTAKLKDLSNVMEFLEKKISDFDEEILKEEEALIVLKGNRQLSLIEKFIRNRKLYNIDKTNKDGTGNDSL
jgi:hypothetical protein